MTYFTPELPPSFPPIAHSVGVSEEQDPSRKRHIDEVEGDRAEETSPALKIAKLSQHITWPTQRIAGPIFAQNPSNTTVPSQSPQDLPSSPLSLLDSLTIENILMNIGDPSVQKGFCEACGLGQIRSCHQVDQRLSAVFRALEIQERLNDRFGLPPQSISFYEEAMQFIAEMRRKVNIMNEALPEDLRSNIPAIDLIKDVKKLEAFFQTAYDYSLVQAFGKLAGVDYALPIEKKARQVRDWLDTSEVGQFTSLEGWGLSHKKLVLGFVHKVGHPFRCPPTSGIILAPAQRKWPTFCVHYEQCLVLLPKEIGKFTSLKVLNLDSNNLTWLPKEIGKLQALQTLRLDYNQLKSLPSTIGKLQSLKLLRLRHNELTTLPSEIGELRALEVLNLEDNQLPSLPPEIGKIQALERLCLQCNQLASLPTEIQNLHWLDYLDLRNNTHAFSHEELGSLSSIPRLHL